MHTTDGAAPRDSKGRRTKWVTVLALVLALVVAGVVVGLVSVYRPDTRPGLTSPSMAKAQKPGHVFVINLENTGFERAWGADSLAPYLSKDLRAQGVLLENYYAVYHSSLPNYIAQISGQGPNQNTANDCAVFHRFSSKVISGFGQVKGKGCLYPATVPTLAGQLESKHLTWKGYMEDMSEPCLHPALGDADPNKQATPSSGYVTRHNPFVYFASIINSPDCAKKVVNLSVLPKDLAEAATTPNLSYITPNVCNDGHDNPCADGSYGGLEAADKWLKEWVPRIMDSPAYKADGMLVITFDEGDGELKPGTAVTSSPTLDATDQGPGAPLPAIFGDGGGRIGALVISPLVEPGSTSQVVYNHYSLLASIEDAFSLPYIGYAQTTQLNKFGPDVYNKDPGPSPAN
ncbi:alkaline phosphatase family protein [Arthrobacter sp.]|uniref:alkaline phosphatase family protein n=1 Tax=Arthrobacter sp. TaxID=1667 RepID=UPI002584C9BE|nr:alkaline phosphatase family protein [Arthrobacter sp.]